MRQQRSRGDSRGPGHDPSARSTLPQIAAPDQPRRSSLIRTGTARLTSCVLSRDLTIKITVAAPERTGVGTEIRTRRRGAGASVDARAVKDRRLTRTPGVPLHVVPLCPEANGMPAGAERAPRNRPPIRGGIGRDARANPAA